MIIYTTKNRFFVATDIYDYVQWLQRNTFSIHEELNKHILGNTNGRSKAIGKNSLELKRYNYSYTI